jgi:CelD/BcsL family acetyltransferase involved in cellulose biosynthesis
VVETVARIFRHAGSLSDVRLHERIEELEALRSRWDGLCARTSWGSFFQTPAWVISWCRAFGFQRLCSASAWRRGELVGLAPLGFDSSGDLVALGTPLNDENTFVLESGAAELGLALLSRLADDRRCRRIALLPTEATGSLLERADLAGRTSWSLTVTDREPAARLELPRTWQAYLDALSPSRRKRFLHVLSRADRAWRFELMVGKAPDIPSPDVRMLLDLREQSARLRGLWSQFPPEARGDRFDEHVRLLCASAPGPGADTLLIKLYRGGDILAAGLYLRLRDTVMKYCHGWRGDLQSFSPGTVLDLATIGWCIERGYRVFDLGRGLEAYKGWLGASAVELSSVVLNRGDPPR